MGITLPIVLYTHTDMKDIWPMVFGQMKKYAMDFKVYVAVNNKDTDVPEEYTQLIYDDSLPYTSRWEQILPQIGEDVILFLHEDMILLGIPQIELLEVYRELVTSKKVNSVKLIFAGTDASPSFIHPTLVSNQLSKLSIQPTIISKKSFKEILTEVGPQNIWDFEKLVTPRLCDFMVRLGTETKRGMYHYDSQVFPYIATAINKGKWNYTEYKEELRVLFTEYSITPDERGIV